MNEIISFDRIIQSQNSFLEQNINKSEKGYNNIFSDVLEITNKYQVDADKAATELSTGKVKDIHKTMIALEKSSISLQLLIEIRNSIIDAYKELSRMQV